MKVADKIERNQPEVHDFLIKCFDLDLPLSGRKIPKFFPEDDPNYRKYRDMMTEKSSAQK